jgi:hypothetical protein
MLSHLLAANSNFTRTVPSEVRFITERGGLLDLLVVSQPEFPRFTKSLRDRLRPRASQELFVSRMRGDWFDRRRPDGLVRGLHRGMTQAELEVALAEFDRDFANQPLVAARKLVTQVFSAITKTQNGWVETTPDNVIRANQLLALFPSAKILHVVRDGRDVASSVVRRTWGPNDLVSALRWWYQRMRRAYRTLAALPEGAVLTIRLENLVTRSPDATYRQLIEYLGVTDQAEMRDFMNEQITEGRMHGGRWVDELSGVSRRQFNDLYGRLLVSLKTEFGDVTPTEDLLTR